MRPALSFLLLGLALGAGVGCQSPESGKPLPPESQVLQQLERLAKAMETNDHGKVLGFYTPDALVTDGPYRSKGHEAIRQHWGKSQYAITRARLLPQATVKDGAFIRQTGIIQHEVTQKDGKRGTATGRFEASWGLEPDGTWRIRLWETVGSK